ALQASGGNPSEAEALLQLAVAAWPDNPRHLLALAQCIAHSCKEPERALTWCPGCRAAATWPLTSATWLLPHRLLPQVRPADRGGGQPAAPGGALQGSGGTGVAAGGAEGH
ncbi:uncharacterized protein HaLaN_31180, partial [Haematococcus lacustris]